MYSTDNFFSISVVQALSINELDGMTFYGSGVNGTSAAWVHYVFEFLRENLIVTQLNMYSISTSPIEHKNSSLRSLEGQK